MSRSAGADAMTAEAETANESDLLRVDDLVVEYPLRDGSKIHAVSGISFSVRRGETLALVGESGCGKSSTGRAILQLPPPTSGRVHLGDTELTALNARERRLIRPRLQMILQDPRGSLNPRRKVRDLVREGLRIWPLEDGTEADERVNDALGAVGLDPKRYGDRRSGQLSGGQCQRVAIARALVMRPDLLVCDEAVSALDVTVKAQIVELLLEMKERYQLTMIFISHDLGIVADMADRALVMYLGRIVEEGPARAIFERPKHPYTLSLVQSVLSPDPLESPSPHVPMGEPPNPSDPPPGCRFHPRCVNAGAICTDQEPLLEARWGGRHVACHFPVGHTSAHAGANPQ